MKKFPVRYDRQIAIEGFKQEKLSKACVAIAGLGGLGSSAAFYLAAAGVGELILIDYDLIEESNLNRQILHFTPDLGKPKTQSAKEKIALLNPEIKVTTLTAQLRKETLELIGEPDVIIDALDNMETRFILNEYSYKKRIPLIHAAISGFEGRITTLLPGRTPCLACIYKKPSPKMCFPVIGVTPGILGIMQAAEAIKLLTGMGKPLTGVLLTIDLLNWEIYKTRTTFDPGCLVCGRRERGNGS